MHSTPNFFFDHLMPTAAYQSVRAKVADSPDSLLLLHQILLLTVAQAVLASLPSGESKQRFVSYLSQTDPSCIELLKSDLPTVTSVIRQTLDRTLLALTAALE